jgi:hypothetical protein
MNATKLVIEVGSLVRLTGTPGHSPMRVRSIVGDSAYCVWPSVGGHPYADWFCLSGLRLVPEAEGLEVTEEQGRRPSSAGVRR